MKLVIFGLTISSSWGNGHATLWRGLCRALARLGHQILFFERDVPYYARHRDLSEPPGCDLHLYRDWSTVLATAKSELLDADVAMVTSYCPDGVSATELVLSSAGTLSTFYDLDTPVTLRRLREGERIEYLAPTGLNGFDLVLSYTGGVALDLLRTELGAKRVAPLYGSVDPDVHRPVDAVSNYQSDLSYLGTYSADRQERLRKLFLEPARKLPGRRFLIGGAQYPVDFPWCENIWYIPHVPPANHPPFYCSSSLTLNVTRGAMAEMGFCPSGRLFEAAACSVPVLTDWWEGLENFFEPGREILIAQDTNDALEALAFGPADLLKVAQAARERVLAEHTAERRAQDLLDILHSLPGSPTGRADLMARA
jgi:spore maturation protein CgeB